MGRAAFAPLPLRERHCGCRYLGLYSQIERSVNRYSEIASKKSKKTPCVTGTYGKIGLG